jgi:RNA polymerase sigma-70 factor (ECF subfamily)
MKTDLKVVQTNQLDLNDPVIFGELYEEYFPKVYNYVRYRILDPTTADDLTARTFYKALDRRSSYDPSRAGFGTWILTIARNAVNDYLRANRRYKLFSVRWLRDRASITPNPEQLLIEREAQDRLLSAIGELSKRERDILALKYAAGKTNRSIADMAGLSESNIAVIVHRAVAKLRRVMAEEEERSE